jgi:hypothetical protein
MFPRVQNGDNSIARFFYGDAMSWYKLIAKIWKRKLRAHASARELVLFSSSNVGLGVEHVECGQHHPAVSYFCDIS